MATTKRTASHLEDTFTSITVVGLQYKQHISETMAIKMKQGGSDNPKPTRTQ